MGKKPAIFSLLLALILITGCDVMITPPAVSGGVRVSTSADPVVVYRSPRMNAYPGAEVTRKELRDARSRVEFRTAASLTQVYTHHHNQLTRAGWRRSEFRQRPNRVDATYVRGSASIELQLNRRGRSGDYRLELRHR